MNLIAGAIVWFASAIMFCGACLISVFAHENDTPAGILFFGGIVFFIAGFFVFGGSSKVKILRESERMAPSFPSESERKL